MGGQMRRLQLRLRGPAQMGLILPGNLTDWSFGTAVPPPRTDCQCHFVFLATGTPAASWTFSFSVPGGGHRGAKRAAAVELIYYGHYLDVRTPLLAEAEATLPSWATPVSFVSILGSAKV